MEQKEAAGGNKSKSLLGGPGRKRAAEGERRGMYSDEGEECGTYFRNLTSPI